MEGRPQGITYSRQVTSTRPIQQGTPTGGAPPAAPNPTSFPTGTATPSTSTGTTYLTINRGLLIAGLLFSLASPASFGVEAYVFMGMMLIPTVIALGLILSVNRGWAYITSTVLGLVFPLFFLAMFGPHEGAYNPVNREAFGVAAFNLAAIPLILVGGIGGFRNTRGKTGVSFGSGFRTAPGVFALCVCSLLVGALVTSYVANDNVLATPVSGFDAPVQATTSVAMKEFAFDPKTINVGANTYTEIVVVDQDPNAHTFTYKNEGVEYSHELLPGQTVSFVVLFDTVGTYGFWCIPHSNGEGDTAEDSMVGQIIVA